MATESPLAQKEETPATLHIEKGTESADLITDAIERFADAAEKLLNTGLTDRAIIVLLQDRLIGVGKREIKLVLDALPGLRAYIK